jgi:hypothetical protein
MAALSASALAQTCPNIDCDQSPHTGRQINISGATLLRDFFRTTAPTNDFVDVNGNGVAGFDENRIPPLETLGPSNNYSYLWILQNRAVGSVEGFVEFVNYQLCCDVPDVLCTDESRINAVTYAGTGGVPVGTLGPCLQDNDGDGVVHGAGNPNGTGTPVCPCAIDIAILDVPSFWAVQGPAGATLWSRKPGQAGYGVNPGQSIAIPGSCPTSGAFGSNLATLSRTIGGNPPCNPGPGGALNTNTTSPDDNTIFDFAFTAAPVVPIANRGTGLQNVTFTDLRYLQVTGRMPNGDNLASGTRDAGSGTRNAWCNSLGVDPAHGRGDNRGARTSGSTFLQATNLGPCQRMTNCCSSSHIENAVAQRRNGIGYTGIAGSTAAAFDAFAGDYEILNTRNDVAGGTQFVRPTITTIVNNDDVNAGWRISGPGTFVTRGDIDVSSPVSPSYNPGLPHAMENEDAADFLYNIRESIEAFIAPGGAQNNQNLLMPGQYLATSFFLLAGLDARQSAIDPTLFTPQTPNADLRNYIIANNNFGLSIATNPPDGTVTPVFGSRNEAGKVPNRGGTPYAYRNTAGQTFSIAEGTGLSIRNRVAGDFLYDEQRNCADIPRMVAAFAAGRDGNGISQYFENPVPPLPGGAMDDPGLANTDAAGNNLIIVDILGDVDGNGAFDAADIRYFADGHAISGGSLNRACGFTAVDTAWTVGTVDRPAGNFFNTTITDGCGNSRPYTAGASRFDLVGSATGPAEGDAPIGANGVVNEADYAYIWQNQGSWNNLDDAARIDLSCDMNGDLVVNIDDATALVEQAWGRCLGDIDCNGSVDLNDLSRLLANYGRTSGVAYTDGDLDVNGQVDLSDLALLLGKFGRVFPDCS